MAGGASANWARAGRDVLVKSGLDEEQTVALFSQLIAARETEALALSAKRYFDALQSFCSVSYQSVGVGFPTELSGEQVYVPLRGKNISAPEETAFLSEAFRPQFKNFSKRILIEGGPGSGKSTLLREIAKCAWNEPQAVGLDGRYIALPIRLRSFGEVNGAVIEERILRSLDAGRQIAIKGPPPPTGFFEEWPNKLEAPWLFLLDGFDEIATEHRHYVLNWLEQLVGDEHALILTTRPTEIPPSLRKALVEFQLQPFSDKQQRELARKWLGQKADDFLKEFARYSNGELGGTPLLLTIAAFVHYQFGELPLRRSELYAMFVSATWQETQSRGAKEHLSPELFDLSFLCLQRIARTMTEGRGRGSALDFGAGHDFLISSLAEFLAEVLGLTSTVAQIKAKHVLAALTNYSGILRAEPNQIEWFHPTFREFLAASDFANASKDTIDQLLQRCGDVTWRQVILFLVSIQSESGDVEGTLRTLMAAAPPSGVEVAAVAIAEGANIEQPMVNEVVQALCREIAQLSHRGYCERSLMTASIKSDRLVSTLKNLTSEIDLSPELELLYQGLVRSAIEYGGHDACGIQDLMKLGAPYKFVAQIAGSHEARMPVRVSAAASLMALGREDEAYAAFADTVALAKVDAEQRTEMTRLISHHCNADLFASLAARGAFSDLQWASLLDSVDDEHKPSLLESLSDDLRLSETQRVYSRKGISSEPSGHELDHCGLDEGEACG
ncbi:hypothetical protein BMW22_20190 [Rhizobium leguminosarum]|uniref:NACHT domain-containing protein n=1 Tax=Rhizobium leguminosarum TaxID=384 RepID=A0A1L3ZD95_RHILE|nr:NACHT domain-containing protein [Rhizobium leguminosarum]API53619.1 hypothetical protein BMW22_20190 [Rhizobium leguminosarum]